MIFCCQDFRQGHLPLDGIFEALGKGHDATFVAFGLINVEAVFSQVDVFDSQVQGLADSQPTTVKKVDDETGWVTVNV